MRPVFLLLLSYFLVGCGPQIRASAEPQNGVCLRALQFEDASARNAFLGENAATIADRFNPPGTLYLQTDSPEAMRFAIAAPNCQRPDDLAPLTRTEGVSSVQAVFVHTFDVDEEFASPPTLVSDADERSCIVIADVASADRRFGLILGELAYGGVQFRQVMGAGDRTFIASDDNCDLTLRFVEAVADEIGLANANAQACPSHTLRECVR
jgi:hypothetical protein